MALRKNKKFIDPRYFMDEKTETINEAWDSSGNWKSRYSDGRSKSSDVEPETDEERAHRRAKEAREDERRREAGQPKVKSKYFGDFNEENEIEEQGSFSVSGPNPKDALSTHDLFRLFEAGISPEELRGVNNTNLTPEMKSILGHSDAEDSPHDEGF